MPSKLVIRRLHAKSTNEASNCAMGGMLGDHLCLAKLGDVWLNHEIANNCLAQCCEDIYKGRT